MTKQEHEMLQRFVNKMSEYQDKADRAFKRLQELNGTEGTGHRWCSAQTNAKDLLSVGKDYMYLYDDYVEANAAIDTITKLGSELAELGFWKGRWA